MSHPPSPQPSDLPHFLGAGMTVQGFIAYPHALLQCLTAEQCVWQWSVYEAALAQAQAAVLDARRDDEGFASPN